jgi:hypothetical protein
MGIINKFQYFIESYLEGNRAPLYHFTKLDKLNNILDDNELKPSAPAFGINGYRDNLNKSISLTRFPGYSGNFTVCRITLDTNLLLRDGYKPRPIDEVGIAILKSKNKKNKHYSKFNHKNLKYTHHNTQNVENISGLEQEYEERIYKSIKMVGKYITFIDFDFDTTALSTLQNGRRSLVLRYPNIVNYIKKYPHIKVRKIIYASSKSGRSPWPIPKETVLDIDIIEREM